MHVDASIAAVDSPIWKSHQGRPTHIRAPVKGTVHTITEGTGYEVWVRVLDFRTCHFLYKRGRRRNKAGTAMIVDESVSTTLLLLLCRRVSPDFGARGQITYVSPRLSTNSLRWAEASSATNKAEKFKRRFS